jgi:hypothetical protein
MSLQLAAQHMASRGRGPDSTLVHMAPQEVAGLQALAKAHGGSLTINPDTGLAEAGFLKNILPTLIGVGLSVASGGALTPLMAAGITGAGYGLASGSLSKGLMAGLGAYGGAGLAGGLMGAGAAGAGAAGASEMAATQAGLQQNALTGLGVPSSAAAGTGSMSFAPDMGANILGSAPTAAGPMSVPVSTGQLASGIPQVATATPMPTAPVSMADKFAQAGRGFESVMENPMDFATKENMKYGLAAAAPMLFQDPEQQAEREKEKAYQYSYDPGRVEDPQAGYTGAYTGERTYFKPSFVRTAADGGLMALGPVQEMSNRNEAQTLMANGGQMFAEGGDVKAVQRVGDDPYYTMTGQSGDAFKYLMGQGPKSSAAPAPAAVQDAAKTPTATPQAQAQPKPIIDAFQKLFPGGNFGQLSEAMYPSQNDSSLGRMVEDTNTKSYSFDPVTGAFTNMPSPQVYQAYPVSQPSYDGGYADGGIASLAQGGASHLGDYSDGGRLLRGPGDGVSDSIPASIGNKRPARLADGEFVLSADVVSGLGNGSTEAGARKLYAMMDRVRKARTGTKKMGKTVNPDKLIPV